MKELFKFSFTLEDIQDIYGSWDNEGILYGWENGAAGEVRELLEKSNYDLDSISVMNEAFQTLDDLIWEYSQQ